MTKFILVIVVQLLFISLAHSDVNNCGNRKPLWGDPGENCICGEALSKLKLTSPYEGLKITQVCDYKEIGSGIEKEKMGLFIFSGNYIADGRVLFERTEHSYELYFEGGKTKKALPFSFEEGMAGLRFEKREADAKSFGIDFVSNNNFCITNKVKISISELYILIDGGTDAMGNFQ